MTTGQIENAANQGGLVTPDFPIKSVLRYKVIPDFLTEVGSPQWLKRNSTITTAAGTQDYALPSNFLRMRKIATPSNYAYDEIVYCGENEDLVTQLEQETSAGVPCRYRIIQNSDNEFQSIRFYPKPDAVYTFPYIYVLFIPFDSETEDVDLTPYIPPPLHWALVEGLKAEVLNEAFGEGDYRFARAQREYSRWIEKANRMDLREPGPRNHNKYAR